MIRSTICYLENNGSWLMLYRDKKPGDMNEGKWISVGGKVEAGETPEEALIREIKEELDTLVSVDEFLMTVEYDYPEFHISMDCFICSVISGELTLLEHESARWLPLSDPWQVRWLPSDIEVIKKLSGKA